MSEESKNNNKAKNKEAMFVVEFRFVDHPAVESIYSQPINESLVQAILNFSRDSWAKPFQVPTSDGSVMYLTQSCFPKFLISFKAVNQEND